MQYGAIKYLRFDGLVANTPFTLPANHIITEVLAIARTGNNVDLEFKRSGSQLATVSGTTSGFFSVGAGIARMYETDQTIDITCSNWPSGSFEADVIVTLLDLSI